MAVTTMKALLEAGVHFGHQTKRWNPKMAKYIYATRNDIHIIDLQISVDHVEAAYQFVKNISAEGKSVLFVGTKKQAQSEMAGRHSHQLQDHPHPHRQTEQDQPDGAHR